MTAKLVFGLLLAMVMTAIPSLAAENESPEGITISENMTAVSNTTNLTEINSTEELIEVTNAESVVTRPTIILLGSISSDPQSIDDPRITKLSGVDPRVFEQEQFKKTPGGITSEYGTDEQLRFLNS